MPTYQGQVSEEQLIALIAYIQSLQVPTEAAPVPDARRGNEGGDRDEHRAPARRRTHYLSGGWDLKSWLLTTDHKRIGILYLVSITLMFALGGFYAAPRPLEPDRPGRQPHVRPRPTTSPSPPTA